MIKRGFSQREKTMLVILSFVLILCLYLWVIDLPCKKALSQAAVSNSELSLSISVEEARAEKKKAMELELDKVNQSSEKIARTPDYDNVQNIVKSLNKALASSTDYNLNFSTLDFNSETGFVTRPINMQFTAANYTTAYSIIEKLYSSDYRCTITSFSMSPVDSKTVVTSGQPVSVVLTINYYELFQQPQQNT